ncbi:MAG: hypothetical protein JSU08_02270 [Acidobacteria bacterium]|nr:hypothetical protein [Acidobacteriota bacterium]
MGRALRSAVVAAIALLAWLVPTMGGVALHAAQATAAVGRAVAADDAELYDLQRDEALGGHTLARHVGRTDEQLAERLRREPNISAASTWTDERTARRGVAAAIRQSQPRIRAWASRQGSRPNLVLNYAERPGTPLGRSLRRGDRVSRPAERALIVLRWHDRERRWIVLTSYPETSR